MGFLRAPCDLGRKSREFLEGVARIWLESRLGRDQHEVVGGELWGGQSERFPEHAADAVPLHGEFPDLLGYGQAESRVPKAVGDSHEHQDRTLGPLTPAVHVTKVAGSSQVERSWKSEARRHRRPAILPALKPCFTNP